MTSPTTPNIKLHLYAAPPSLVSAGSQSIHGHSLNIISIDPAHPTSITRSMEQFASDLEQLPRCYFEWDGSFGCSEHIGDQHLQLFGMVYDLGPSIQRVELQGTCTLDTWQSLCQFLGHAERPLVAHLLEHHCYALATETEKLWNAPQF